MGAKKRAAWILFAALASASSLMAAPGWSGYANGRFGYRVDIPPGFSELVESGNGDGGISSSADGRAQLSVWGSYPAESSFSAEIEWRVGEGRSGGWAITYRKQTPDWAVWSGSRDGRILYERAIPVCDGAVAYFRLEYDGAQAKALDPIIRHLARSLRSGSC